MATPKPRVKVPRRAAAGEIITIKTLISHKMESGRRINKQGSLVPRQIINKFRCDFNGETVFSCDIEPAIASNPYFSFKARVDAGGVFTFTWSDDNGDVYSTQKTIELTS